MNITVVTYNRISTLNGQNEDNQLLTSQDRSN